MRCICFRIKILSEIVKFYGHLTLYTQYSYGIRTKTLRNYSMKGRKPSAVATERTLYLYAYVWNVRNAKKSYKESFGSLYGKWQV